MSRARKQDCWQASVRISIPIDATRPETIAEAQQWVRDLATLRHGSSVEITHAGFGRMAAAERVDPQGAITGVIITSSGPGTETKIETVTSQPEIPSFLRRNGAADEPPLDPSIDAR